MEPELLFKMLLLGYLYGIPSEVKLTEKGLDHATISINRVWRFRDNNITEQIFNEIFRQCIAKGLVGSKSLYTDSSHIKIKANKYCKDVVTVDQTPKAYMDELNAQIDLDRKVLGKSLLTGTTIRPSTEVRLQKL